MIKCRRQSWYELKASSTSTATMVTGRFAPLTFRPLPSLDVSPLGRSGALAAAVGRLQQRQHHHVEAAAGVFTPERSNHP